MFLKVMKSGTLFLFHHHKIGNRRSFNETVNSSLSFLFQVVLRSFVSRTAANIIQKTHISLVYTQSNDRKNNSILHNNRLTTIKLMLKQRNHASKFLKSDNGFEFPMSNHVWSNFMKFRFSRCFLPRHKQTNEFNFFFVSPSLPFSRGYNKVYT